MSSKRVYFRFGFCYNVYSQRERNAADKKKKKRNFQKTLDRPKKICYNKLESETENSTLTTELRRLKQSAETIDAHSATGRLGMVSYIAEYEKITEL